MSVVEIPIFVFLPISIVVKRYVPIPIKEEAPVSVAAEQDVSIHVHAKEGCPASVVFEDVPIPTPDVHVVVLVPVI